MKLYGYWRSTAAYRVRIALNLKGLAFTTMPVNLVADGGEQHDRAYCDLNPQHLVPTLVDGETVIGQSLAIIEYLEESHPAPPLLPAKMSARARARQVALAVAADTHPLNNLRVLQYLGGELGAGEEARRAWYHHWLRLGCDAVERLVDEDGPYAMGAQVGIADACIVPQLYNARRYAFPLDACPKLRRIDQACAALDAFKRAAPEVQPDAV